LDRGVLLDKSAVVGAGLMGTQIGVVLSKRSRVAEHLWKFLDGWQEPIAYLNEMVERGNTGIESGRGFYDWIGKEPSAVRKRKNESLFRLYEGTLHDWENEKNDSCDKKNE
jgi:3-hydroxyacyl-CoA dehydrogenase